MIRNSFFSAAVAILVSFCLGWSAHAAAPEEQLIEAVKVALGSTRREARDVKRRRESNGRCCRRRAFGPLCSLNQGVGDFKRQFFNVGVVE